jgi:hypothetical protein
VADLQQAVFLGPLTSEVQWGVEHAVKTLFRLGYDGAKAGDDTGATAAYNLVVTLSPANAEALKWKVAADNRISNSETVARLEAASRADPGDFDTFKRLDDELVNTQQFGRIVQHWDRYLAEKPSDARATSNTVAPTYTSATSSKRSPSSRERARWASDRAVPALNSCASSNRPSTRVG